VADRLRLGDLELVVGRRRVLVLLRIQLRHVELDDVCAHLHRDAGRVVDRVEGVAATLLVDVASARVGPDHERHSEAVAVPAHLAELDEIVVLPRRSDIERVADRVGADPDAILDRRVAGRERLVGGRYFGLRVQLQQQGDLAGIVRVVLARHAVAAGDPGVAGLGGEPELIFGVFRGRVREEVAGAVLDALVDRQEEKCALAGAELVKQSPQARTLSGRERRQKRLRLGA
jgi:hypothetical protein